METPKAPCPDCGRLIALDGDGNIWAHGGKSSSGFRCPGAGRPPLASVPLVEVLAGFQVGDRVIRYPDGPRGVVTALDTEGRVFVHWGTTMVRDSEGNPIENRFEGWLSSEELKLEEEPVWVGDVETGQKTKVWDPMVRGN